MRCTSPKSLAPLTLRIQAGERLRVTQAPHNLVPALLVRVNVTLQKASDISNSSLATTLKLWKLDSSDSILQQVARGRATYL